MKPINTLIPGAAPIELVAYYPEFVDYYPKCELQTKRWFVEHVQRDWTLFDAGANIGYYSILFSRLAPAGKIFSFEPTETIELLRANLDHHRCTNVTPLKIALGENAGVYEDNIYRIWGEQPERQQYTFSTIDAMIGKLELDRLDCIKIDVDSFDFEVLRGAENTLRFFDPWVVVELNDALARRNQFVPQALEWLHSLGYTTAHVTDYENYILKRESRISVSLVGPTMALSFESRPILMPSPFARGEKIDSVFDTSPRSHGAASVALAQDRERAVWLIAAPGPQWSYAASWLRDERIPPGGAVIVEADVEVSEGVIGMGCVKADNATFVGLEAKLKAAPGVQTVRIFIDDTKEVAYVVLRNADPNGSAAVAYVHEIRTYRASEMPSKPSPALLAAAKTRLSLAECVIALRGGDTFEIATDPGSPGLGVTGVEELGKALGFARAFVPEIRVYEHALADFKTEVDEAAIYSYLYREFRPRRHLEFGTSEGWGTVQCASVSDAEIWTVNLPESEWDKEESDLRSSAGKEGSRSIGWRYRVGGFEARVHQILCDSRDLDVERFGAGFFDSVSIDAGHAQDVIVSETDKALFFLRPGGLLIWHGFCPDPETLAQSEVSRSVMAAVLENFARWSPVLRSWFWVRPSWIMIGVKA